MSEMTIFSICQENVEEFPKKNIRTLIPETLGKPQTISF